LELVSGSFEASVLPSILSCYQIHNNQQIFVANDHYLLLIANFTMFRFERVGWGVTVLCASTQICQVAHHWDQPLILGRPTDTEMYHIKGDRTYSEILIPLSCLTPRMKIPMLMASAPVLFSWAHARKRTFYLSPLLSFISDMPLLAAQLNHLYIMVAISVVPYMLCAISKLY
jgi:hypothetical protein